MSGDRSHTNAKRGSGRLQVRDDGETISARHQGERKKEFAKGRRGRILDEVSG